MVINDWIKNRKRIIVFEGPDGSGKTTQCKAIEQQLEKDGIKAVWLPQPFMFRERLINDKDLTESERVALFLTDYDLVVNKVLFHSPHEVLILDRTPYVSYFVYNMPHDKSGHLTEYVKQRYQHIIKPDIIFVLN